MPPPKKPKRGPTSADQFLSEEERKKQTDLGELHDRMMSESPEPRTGVEEETRQASSDLSMTDAARDSDRQNAMCDIERSEDANSDVPMNLSSIDLHRLNPVRDTDRNLGIETVVTHASDLVTSPTGLMITTSSYATSPDYTTSPSYSAFRNPESVLRMPKSEPGSVASELEPPVLQRMTDTELSAPYSVPRQVSPLSQGSSASPSVTQRLQAPPIHLQRHQSPMLTLMMAVPTSQAIWQPALSIQEGMGHPHLHYPTASLPGPMVDNPNAVPIRPSTQPFDFSKRGTGRSEGGSSRKRKARYSLLSAALSGSVASTTTVHSNVTVSTSTRSRDDSQTMSRELDRKHVIDLLRTSNSTGMDLPHTITSNSMVSEMMLISNSSRTNLLLTSNSRANSVRNSNSDSDLIRTSNSGTDLLQTGPDLLRTSNSGPDLLRTSNCRADLLHTSSASSVDMLHPTAERLKDRTQISVPSNSAYDVRDPDNLMCSNSIITSSKILHKSSGARLVMEGLVTPPVTSSTTYSVSDIMKSPTRLSETTVMANSRFPLDSVRTPHINNAMSTNSRLVTDTIMTTSLRGLNSASSQLPPLDELRDGSVIEPSGCPDSHSREGEDELEGGASPMQSPISSTSMAALGHGVHAAMAAACTSSCLLPEERMHNGGSESSAEMEAGSSLHGLDSTSTFDPSKVVCKEEHIPGSSTVGGGTSRQCQVCSDGASGFHYGVWSCEGCKAFFKRSIQGPVDYICPATNNCTIDKHRRKSCQACRLRKCYEVGMNKGTNQRKERRSSSNSSNASTPGSRPRKRPRQDSMSMTNGTKKRLSHVAVMVLESLIQADTPVLESFHDHSLPPTKIHVLSSLLKIADRELVYLINWAKHVQGYTDLVLCDQVHLIECCWMELLLLSCAFRSIEYQGKQLVFASDLILDRQLWYTLDMVDVLEQVAAISGQMAALGIHKEELLLLKALSLANAEVRQLSNPGLLSNMRVNLIDALTATAQKHHAQNWGYVPSLMLLLAHVRQASLQTIHHLQRLKHEGLVPFCDLLKEMLEAQSLPADEKSALTQCG